MMKRSKRAVVQSPSSSTPTISRHGLDHSPLFSLCNRDSDNDNSAEHFGLQVSPLFSRSRLLSAICSPLEVDSQPTKGYFSCMSPSCGRDTPSPDGHAYNPDLSDRSIGKGYLSDHLQHSLSYARRMEQRALHISARISQSANLSMSPRLLFTPETCNSSDTADSISGQRKRQSVVDDLNMHSFMTISQQTTSTVERYARLADVCPDLLNRRTVNRFMSQYTPGEKYQEERPIGMNPIFNCNNSSVEMLNEVQALALLQHSNIIRFFGSWYEADSVYTQLELCLGGSLFHLLYPDRQNDTSEAVSLVSANHIDNEIPGSPTSGSPSDANRNRLSEKPLIVLASHVLSALHYMHTNWSMVHGDVKPSNILIQLSRPEAYLASAKECIEMDAKRHCHKVSYSVLPILNLLK
ncbi:unnamed protein product [Schistosoma mattheei]|uniref:Uncharacterized protein n=1 Tax=Schistosoma mattheei TaxID=31246 RepID=A0A183NJG3_9TREM|nr:unnamed protein product [Schistosoma mattheei]